MRLTVARYYTPSGRSIQKPYNEGTDKYYEDFHQRIEKGETLADDSILLSKLPQFKTPGGRTLYGEGGIMPDKFIAPDTTGISVYFMRVRSSLIYRFSLKYTEANREALSKFTDAGALEKYLDKQGLLEKFVLFAAQNGVKKDPDGIRESGRIINTELKAYIARNILDNKGFYPIWTQIDTTMKVAIDFLKK